MSDSQGSTPAARMAVVEGLVQFVKDTWAELHRVQWPSRQTVIKHTVVVVSLIVFMACYIGALDGVISLFFMKVLGVGAGKQ